MHYELIDIQNLKTKTLLGEWIREKNKEFTVEKNAKK